MRWRLLERRFDDRCRLRLCRFRDEDDEDEEEEGVDRERDRETERLAGERGARFDADEGLIEFFNSSISVMDVVFEGRLLEVRLLFASTDEPFERSAIFESAKMKEQ